MNPACILSKFLPIVVGTAALILSVGGSTLSAASDWPGLAVVPAPSGVQILFLKTAPSGS